MSSEERADGFHVLHAPKSISVDEDLAKFQELKSPTDVPATAGGLEPFTQAGDQALEGITCDQQIPGGLGDDMRARLVHRSEVVETIKVRMAFLGLGVSAVLSVAAIVIMTLEHTTQTRELLFVHTVLFFVGQVAFVGAEIVVYNRLKRWGLKGVVPFIVFCVVPFVLYHPVVSVVFLASEIDPSETGYNVMVSVCIVFGVGYAMIGLLHFSLILKKLRRPRPVTRGGRQSEEMRAMEGPVTSAGSAMDLNIV